MKGDKNDSVRVIFGNDMVGKLAKLNYFLVGAGAIGCEVLKNWSLIGLGEKSAGGKILVTDMDRIEKSNLSRQLLFRSSDIGHAKSTRAALAAQQLNPSINVEGVEKRVGADSEDTFDDKFWSSLDGVHLGVPRCCGAFTPSTRLVSIRRGLGWFLF